MALLWGEGKKVIIGKFCSFAGGITIFLGGNHRTDWISTYPFGHKFQEVFGTQKAVGHPASQGDVVIGNDVWIGQSSSIISGVSIGDGAVIAAHSHVCNHVEPYSIVGGNPARHIRYRFDLEIRYLLCKLRWWDLSVAEITEIRDHLNNPPTVEILESLILRFRTPSDGTE